ncbi:MAG: hypothetical protein ACXWJR_04115 [Xanthobacteraceae bacterium]
MEQEIPLHRDVLIGAQSIADEIGIDVRQCFHWLQNNYIPATKTGSTWTTTRSALRRHFSGGDRGEAAASVIKAPGVLASLPVRNLKRDKSETA